MSETLSAATAEDLQRMAEFDHPFRVHPDGSLSDGLASVYAPDVFHDTETDITVDGIPGVRSADWEALTGRCSRVGRCGGRSFGRVSGHWPAERT